MKKPAHIKVSGALEGEFIITEERSANEFVITRDTAWKAMLGKDEREATTRPKRQSTDRSSPWTAGGSRSPSGGSGSARSCHLSAAMQLLVVASALVFRPQ